MQTLGPIGGDPSKRPGTFAVIRYSIAKEGVRSMYTGLSASLLRQMTYSLVRIGSYEELKRRMSDKGKTPSTGKLLLAASLAGGLGGLAGNPAGECKIFVSLGSYTEYFPPRYTTGQDDKRLCTTTGKAIWLSERLKRFGQSHQGGRSEGFGPGNWNKCYQSSAHERKHPLKMRGFVARY